MLCIVVHAVGDYDSGETYYNNIIVIRRNHIITVSLGSDRGSSITRHV